MLRKVKKRRKLKLERAKISDARQIQELILKYSKKGIMVPRSLANLYEHIREFYIIRDVKSRKVLACGSLHIEWEDIAEIKSLVVDCRNQKKGYGKKIISKLLKEAKILGLEKIFALTTSVDFFSQMGFEVVDKKELPSKVWGDCVNCMKFPDKCDETAMVRIVK